MSVIAPTINRLRFAIRLSALAAVLVAAAASQPSHAQGTHLWTQSRLEEFEKGTPQGVALTSDGHLRQGPGLSEVLVTPSTYVWSVAVDKSGTAYLGTASPATVLRVGPDGKPFTLFETKDLSVQVVRLGPDGALYAAALPSGKVYKLKADATAKQDETSAAVVFDAASLDKTKTGPESANLSDAKSGGDKPDAKSHYVWDLTFDSVGRLYVATGGPGAIYRVDPANSSAKPELFFKCDEEHIRSLAWDANGNLIAGSDGSGLVYRIDPQGKGYVLFEAPKREITAVAVAADGTIYAASVGDKSHNPLPPLPVQGVGMATVTIIQPPSLTAANTSVSVPEGSEIYALTPALGGSAQAPHKLWTGKDEIVYALAARPDGLIALTGNSGRVFRIASDGSYADVAHLEAQQGLSMTAAENAVFIGSGNTGKLFHFAAAASQNEYASDVLDAGALARFGRVEVEPGSTGYEILTRTGNVEQPVRGRGDWGWSDWQPLKDGAVASPAGRFFEWKAVLHPGGNVGSVGVNYLPVNAAPVVDELMVVPGARVNAQSLAQNQMGNQPPTINIVFPSSTQNATFDAGANTPLQAFKDRTSITVHWAAHDDNGDDLTFSIYLRGDGEHVWRLLKDGITDKAYSFDATQIPDGGYQIRVVASDSPSHAPGEALTGAKESERFEVDTTPPTVTGLKAAVGIAECARAHCSQPVLVTFDAEDAFSPIAHAEYSLDAGPWQYIEPVGGLSDSRREHYEVHLPGDGPAGKAGEHLITVRVYDRHDNVGLAKTVFNAAAK
jgi:WD40 repeat protein